MNTARRLILYIEDDPTSQLLVERTLRRAGYHVMMASTGLDGIDLARRLMPDLILTDITLPDLSGREISTILRCEPRFQSIPIVALTAQGEDERETSLASGINGYLGKPFDVEQLPERLEFYLTGGQDMIEAERLSRAQLEYTREVVQRLEQRLRELRDVNQELFRLDQMKDAFIQLTAHELRTPLTLVYGYSRLLTDYGSLKDLMARDDNLNGLVRGLSGAIERMHGIIDELLTMSRIMTNQIDLSPGPTNPERLIRGVLDGYAAAIHDRRLVVHVTPSEWSFPMRCDGDLLALAFANLVSNAIKYTPDGGHIYLAAEVVDGRARFCVRDTGVGIDLRDQALIFERFHAVEDLSMHTTSKTAFGGGGLGLGLAICKGIVEAHAGRIWVESPGHDPERLPGSTFVIEMPVVVEGSVRPQTMHALQRETS